MVTRGKYLVQSPALASLSFLVAMIVTLGVSCQADRKSWAQIPWDEREIVLMRQKETLEKTEEEKDSKGFAVFRTLRRGIQTKVKKVTETVTEVTEAVTNPDTVLDRSIEMLQSHRSGADQATIKVLHNGGTKAVMRSKSNLLSDTEGTRRDLKEVENAEDADQPVATISQVQKWSSSAADHGQGSAQRFLGSSFFWRFMMLFPASHNWLKIYQLSILLPYSVRVVLIGMKVVGNQALNALFFTSKAPVPDSDPQCNPPPDVFERWVQAVTVGITTAFLTDISIYGLYWVQQKKVIERDWEDKMKIAKRREWYFRTILFWILTLLYGSVCQLYTSSS